uniref:Uncharacterized protein n=1 Tax=Thermus caliditerrae TaxID=1330700 RepID=A0A7C5VIA3_9DEIN
MRKGFALVSTLIFLVVMMALLTAYFVLTRMELGTTVASARQTTGFYAAEAGLNLRAEEVRQKFEGYRMPTGTPPNPTNPCQGANQGSGDLGCKTFTLQGRNVITYVTEDPQNADPNLRRKVVPPGEPYQGLMMEEYVYTTLSEAKGPDGHTEAILEMRFKNRLIPLFQFAIFYENDLEFNRTAPMTLNGPVHTNSDLYLDAGRPSSTLTINGRVTAAGRIWRGDKANRDSGGNVQVFDGASPRTVNSTGSLREVPESELRQWNGWMQARQPRLAPPRPATFDPPWRGSAPLSERLYWNKAEVRVVLNLNTTPPSVELRTPNDAPLPFFGRSTPADCGLGYSNTFYNNREQRLIQMLEVDLRALLTCVQDGRVRAPDGGLIRLDDDTDGGLVLFLTVQGPESDRVNNYGVRVRNAAALAAQDGTPVRGLALVTDQALYIQGDFNAQNWRPAALISDSMNLLSNAWADPTNYPRFAGCFGGANRLQGDQKSDPNCRNRGRGVPSGDNLNDTNRWLPQATNTTVNAAVLTGASITPSQGGQGGGGVHNIFRFHEHWGGNTSSCCSGSVSYTVATYTFLGSIVSLWEPRNVSGAFHVGPPWYQPPNRNWGFDTRFSEFQNLPPLTPMAVYLKQERFLRYFER